MTPAPSPAAEPLVTIGVSTYNRAASTLPESLHSALAQTYPRVEVVVCDNASVDETEAFVTGLRDDRLRYHRHPENIGANANFNACLRLARGRYFLLLHDDDVLDPTFVERAVAAMGSGEPGVLLGGVRLIDADGRVRGAVAPPAAGLSSAQLFQQWFDRRFSFYLCSTLFHTERLRQAGGFASPEDLFQDVVAIARLASRAGYVSVPGIGGSFRRHDASRTTAAQARRWARDAAFLLDVLCEEMPDEAAGLRATGAPYLASTSYRYAARERPGPERRRVFHDIYVLFDRSLSPSQYRLWTVGRVLRRGLRRWLRRLPGSAMRAR
jgi:glycosyltransferase involved in cell wall biosynthesis